MGKDNDILKLGKILLIVFIIILTIIALSLANYIFTVNKHKYYIPVTTTKKVNQKFIELNEANKLYYNKIFNEDNFMVALSSAVSSQLDYKNIDLFQREENKFRLAYTNYSLLNDKKDLAFKEINDYAVKTFKTDLFEDNFVNYKNGDYYAFDYETKPKFCLKANKIKSEGNYIIIETYLVDYSEDSCNSNYINILNQEIQKIVNITYEADNNTNYLKSFVILD